MTAADERVRRLLEHRELQLLRAAAIRGRGRRRYARARGEKYLEAVRIDTLRRSRQRSRS